MRTPNKIILRISGLGMVGSQRNEVSRSKGVGVDRFRRLNLSAKISLLPPLTSVENLNPKRDKDTSPERTKVWTEPNPKSKEKVLVVYYLSRIGHLKHPHFMEIFDTKCLNKRKIFAAESARHCLNPIDSALLSPPLGLKPQSLFLLLFCVPSFCALRRPVKK
ncbi:hypothetical protein NE237_015793 [Protea cynaroides]|uniref:SOSEKI DIX-like domain-containing protein n=1 Tax=Protea cynaroides TaxID=273540 RepID=A0A9Q0KEN9_9MAGN|nr:hypothetical protein NE237_015793 [Protea cynaroides]